MRFSIGRKLGLGFGAIIALMIVSATIVHMSQRFMTKNLAEVLDDATPTVRACDRLHSAVSRSVAGLRGYLILGGDPSAAEIFKAERRDAWDELETALADLEKYEQRREAEKDRQLIADIRGLIQSIRKSQQIVEDIAHTEKNIKANYVLLNDAMPRGRAIMAELTAVRNGSNDDAGTAERQKLQEAVADSQASFSMALANLRGFLLSGQEEFRTAFNEEWQKNEVALENAIAHLSEFTAAQRLHWDRYVETRSAFATLPAKIFELREADDWNQAEYLMETQSAPLARSVKQTLSQISGAAEQRLSNRRTELDAAGRAVSIVLVLSTLTGILIAAVIATVLSRKIVGIAQTLAKRADEISRGNLANDALEIESGDELGLLADGFDAMLNNLKDLTGQISSVTENVNAAAAQISSSAKQQACSTKEQASTVQQITSTMQEIAESGNQIVEKAKEVAAAGEEAAHQSKSGIAAVQSTSKTMESIREQVEEVAENIVALSEKTQAVGDIIATVNDIAEQSNLLALNATIEAADAGDEGNRFSVVANEMKNLADQAKTCTVQVRNILGDIQKGINSAVMLTEEAVKRVEMGKHQADISEDAIRRMSETTDDSVQAFQQIIGATNQQQVGFEQVTKGMQYIDQATQQTASGTAQLEQAVVSLSAMGQQLKSAVSSYKLQA